MRGRKSTENLETHQNTPQPSHRDRSCHAQLTYFAPILKVLVCLIPNSSYGACGNEGA